MQNSPHLAGRHRHGTSQGTLSPESLRSVNAAKASWPEHSHYGSPVDNHSGPFSPTTIQSAHFPGSTSSVASDYNAYAGFKRSDSDHSLSAGHGAQLSRLEQVESVRPQRQSSFGVADAKPVDGYPRSHLQTGMGPYSLLNAAPNHSPYDASHAGNQDSTHAPYTAPQNFAPFSLPPPGFSSTTPTTSTRDIESSYVATPLQSAGTVDYQQREETFNRTSGPDMMLLDQMTVPNTMPVFGGEGYNRSPFAIPDDFVAYLFSSQQLDSSGVAGNIGQQGLLK